MVSDNLLATSVALLVASCASVTAMRARNPSSPFVVVVWIVTSFCPAAAKASRICSSVTSFVSWKVIEVPPTNSIPNDIPLMPTMPTEATTSTADIINKILRFPTKSISCLMKRPLRLCTACAIFRPSSPARFFATRSVVF